MDHDTIVDDWRKNAERHDDENYEFLRSMKFGCLAGLSRICPRYDSSTAARYPNAPWVA